ncbi:MAG TPA: hypothetical protein VHN11_12610 [Xanthobacteraceae bacterium]|nr:hypothetical protein [Xanthobacteraceae bacterium]
MKAGSRSPVAAIAPRIARLWFAMMGVGGFGFGLLALKRPFGEDFFLHPLVLFCISVGVALLILRFVLARPVPDIIPERPLILGCLLGLAAFLLGNWIAAHVLMLR